MKSKAALVFGLPFLIMSNSAYATKNTNICLDPSYVVSVWQSVPDADANVIGVTLRSSNSGQIRNYITQGSFDVGNSAAARSLLSMALTAYATQSTVNVGVSDWQYCVAKTISFNGMNWGQTWNMMQILPSK